MIEQLDMFGTAPAPAQAAPPAEPVPAGVHWLHVTTKRAATACGIEEPAFYPKLRVGYAASGEKLAGTANRDDGTVTCRLCIEEMS